jgi:metal-dependent amidase/aminoacylase/carboxypeptidase family protein
MSMVIEINGLADWRRHLHQHPEFGFEETETARFVAEKLRSFGITEITEGIGGTGVVASIRRGTGSRVIALRADMDALRITEQTNVAHASRNPGVMALAGSLAKRSSLSRRDTSS